MRVCQPVRALALLPGLVVTEQRANLDGKPGVALGIEVFDDFEEIIVNPDNGDYLGIRSTTVEQIHDKLDKGTVRSWSSVTTAVVNEIGARP